MHRRRWETRSRVDRRICPSILLALCLLTGAGCNQGGAPLGSPFSASAASPYGSPAGSGTTAYFNELQRHAQSQASLAATQQQRIAELMEMQRASEQQLAQLKAERERAQSGMTEEQRRQDELLAQRAREALGRYGEIDRRAQGLDRNNQDLQLRVAQIQQRNQLLEDQNNLLRQRLDETAQQLASALDATKASEQRIQTMMASTRRRSGAAITANNSFRRNLTAVTVAGLSIRQDGDLVRIELPSDRIFDPQTARLRPDATALIDQVADVIQENYARQVIGVEAHTDNTPLTGTMWRNSHQLTAAQAMAIFEQLSYRQQLLPQQLFVLGHGENYPLASNATAAGQARNRRVEIVIYPEVAGQR